MINQSEIHDFRTEVNLLINNDFPDFSNVNSVIIIDENWKEAEQYLKY